MPCFVAKTGLPSKLTLLALLFGVISSTNSAQADRCDNRSSMGSCIDMNNDGNCTRSTDRPLPTPTVETDGSGLTVSTLYDITTRRDFARAGIVINSPIRFSTDSIIFVANGDVTLCRSPRRTSGIRADFLSVVGLFSTRQVFIDSDVRLADKLGLNARSDQTITIGDRFSLECNQPGCVNFTANQLTVGRSVTLFATDVNVTAQVIFFGANSKLVGLPYETAAGGLIWLNYDRLIADSLLIEGSAIILLSQSCTLATGNRLTNSVIRGIPAPGPGGSSLDMCKALDLTGTRIFNETFGTLRFVE